MPGTSNSEIVTPLPPPPLVATVPSFPSLSPAATPTTLPATPDTEAFSSDHCKQLLLDITSYLLSILRISPLFLKHTPDAYSATLHTLYRRLKTGHLQPAPQPATGNYAEHVRSTMHLRTGKSAANRPLEDFEDVYYALLGQIQECHHTLNMRLNSGFNAVEDPIFVQADVDRVAQEQEQAQAQDQDQDQNRNQNQDQMDEDQMDKDKDKDKDEDADMELDAAALMASTTSIHSFGTTLADYWAVLNGAGFVETLDQAVRRGKVRALHSDVVAQWTEGYITREDYEELVRDLYGEDGDVFMGGMAWVGGWAPAMIAAWLEEKYRVVLGVEREVVLGRKMDERRKGRRVLRGRGEGEGLEKTDQEVRDEMMDVGFGYVGVRATEEGGERRGRKAGVRRRGQRKEECEAEGLRRQHEKQMEMVWEERSMRVHQYRQYLRGVVQPAQQQPGQDNF